MCFLAWVATFVPSLVFGITVGRVAASLDAPRPVPLLSAIIAALAAMYVLDHLISTLHAHHAARRG
ncbi:hypothetical protein [Streptomyces sp. NRRL S-813]|uniref:hypothetical protein n=1 Tax=Streptomyces sp. NRRL S-813 TaxID=1463919 RepID=UPI0004BFD7AB|nr:hypothetical protein [Streptomyces sp. NRRL S-813]